MSIILRRPLRRQPLHATKGRATRDVLFLWSAPAHRSTFLAAATGQDFLAYKRTASTAEELGTIPVEILTSAVGYTALIMLSHPTASQSGSAVVAWPNSYGSTQIRFDASSSGSTFTLTSTISAVNAATIATDSSPNVFDGRPVLGAVTVNGTSVKKGFLQLSAGGYTETTLTGHTLGSLPSDGSLGANPFGETGDQARVLYFAILRGEITGAEFLGLTRDPWSVFAPGARRIWVPSAAVGGNTYNVDLTDAASATDSAAALMTRSGDASESSSATDSAAAGMTRSGAASESSSASDTASAAATFAAAASESASAADASSYTIIAVAAASESASATDQASALMVAEAAASEAASAADEVASGAASYSVSITEAATADDAVTAVATLAASLSETLAAADSITVNLVMETAAAEAASATDATNWGGAIYSVAAEETASLADAVSSALEALAAMQETASAGETFAAILTAGAAVLEVATAAEIAAATWQTTALLTETAVAADTVAESAGGVMSASISEAASASDTITVQYIAGFVAITVAPQRRLTAGAVRTANLNAGDRPANRPGRGR